MNGVPMKFDYSKTINEQLSTFEYYKDRYCSYELQIMRLQQENKKYKEVIDKLKEEINNNMYSYDDGEDCGVDCCCDGFKLLDILKEVE